MSNHGQSNSACSRRQLQDQSGPGNIKGTQNTGSTQYRIRYLRYRTGGPARSFVPQTTDRTHRRRYCGDARAAELLLDQPMPKTPNLVWPCRRCGQQYYLSAAGQR